MIDKPRYSHATKVAQKILKEIQINNPPVDINNILQHLGINLLPYAFPEKVSAILLKENNMFVVGVNDKHHPNRQRFSIAHEIGHFLIHKDRPFVDSFTAGETFYRDGIGDEKLEKEANFFAANLLMPAEKINPPYFW